ncbi:hypothetical protein AB0A74_38885 [Saccharothrix sp. NPDC042600]|uniref:hypothetical protein n=1 Tax=Saccharothrix TaxID=2071 RepID=UPI0033E8A495
MEDFAYPGAEQIRRRDDVRLISGDGHILYVDDKDCGTPRPEFITVYTTDQIGRGGEGVVCFRVTGPSGHLTLELPAVFEIHSGGRKGHADVSTGSGERASVDLRTVGSTQVGVGVAGGEPATLLRLEITP